MQLNKTIYIDLVDPLPKITHLRRVRKAIAIDQITAQCVTYIDSQIERERERDRQTDRERQ